MTIVGIDLGTTNSTCCAWQGEKLVQIPNALNALLTPSVVGVDDKKQVVIGQLAKERLLTHPDKTVAVFKRLMGSDHKIQIASRQYSAPELSSLIIRSLIEDAENHLGENVTEAVISVPAYFNENQRAATKLAGELAGVKVRRLINEPTAAAMAYGLNERQEGTFLILDMGGGTFDVSILEYFSGVMEVHASAGDNFLGGEDFVQVMVDDVLKQLSAIDKDLSSLEQHKLYMQMESLKKRIDELKSTEMTVQVAGDSKELTLDLEWFQRLITPLLLRVKIPIQTALQDAGMTVHEIDDVILVGGATRLRDFRSMIARLFGRLPSCNLDPDIVVGMGAGIQAGLVARNEALQDIVLTDVCPYTLGTEVVDENGVPGFFMPIIERNTVVPVSIEREVWTVIDKQESLMVKIYQGENRRVDKNVFLGFISVPIPKRKAREQSAKIRYSYDMNGLLVVDVTVVSTGEVFNKVIENAPGVLSDSDKQKALKNLDKLKFHPRETQLNAQLVAKGDRLYNASLGLLRDDIAYAINNFEHVLESQNPAAIKKAQKDFAEFLEKVEKENGF